MPLARYKTVRIKVEFVWRCACRGRDDLVELGDEGPEEGDGDEEDEDAEDLKQGEWA